MAISKVVLHDDSGTDRTLVDLTGDTVAPETLMEGATAHDKAGNPIVGTVKPGEGSPQVQSDWAENDPQSPAYVKNRIAYYGDPITSEFLPETTVAKAPDGFPTVISPFNKVFTIDAKYHVTFNGNEYDLVAYDTGGLIGVGSGDPFIMGATDGSLIIVTTSVEAQITVSILETIAVPTPIPDDLIPLTIRNKPGQKDEDGEIFNVYAGPDKNSAPGLNSHSEGLRNISSGETSHAEGSDTIASGETSHTEGSYTIASGLTQHVQGCFNIPDTNDSTFEGVPSNRYAHIVGNGDYDKRSNAHTLDWDGNSWYQGGVLVGGKDMDAPDAGLLPDGVVIKSSTPGSAKFFKITVTDDGVIKATEFTWPTPATVEEPAV